MTVELTVATYNIQKGIGADFRRRPERPAAVLAALNADVVAVQEGDRRFGERAGILDLSDLHARSGLRPVPLPDRLGARAHGWHGNLLLVRRGETRAVQTLHLPGPEPRGALLVDLALPGFGAVRVIAVHLALMAQARREQARLLARLVAEAGQPVIVLGDMNEWRRGRDTLDPLGDHLGAPGVGPSFPAPFPRLALDRIYAGAGLQLVSAHAHDTPEARRASDHLPVVARVKAAIRSADAPPAAAQHG